MHQIGLIDQGPAAVIDKPVNYIFGIFSDELLIGGIGLSNINYSHKKADIGYWISRPHWKKGYISEAIERVLDFGFNEVELNRIELYANAKNIASQGVAKKFGFNLEGKVRDWAWSKQENKFADYYQFALLKSDYLDNNSSK